MGRVRVEVAGATLVVEGEDVLAWAEVDPADPREANRIARARAADYVAANERPARDAQGAENRPARQRLAMMRRLAAGPATKRELLAAMRQAAGWVGGDDWRNRIDELRGRGQRGGGHAPLPIAHDPTVGTYRLAAPFPALTAEDEQAIGRVKAALETLGAVTTRGQVLLDGMFPDIPSSPIARSHVHYPSPRILGALDAAMRDRAVIRMTYTNQQGRTADHDVVPMHYLPGDTAVRVHVVEVDAAGRRTRSFQAALDRVGAVRRLAVEPSRSVFEEPRERLVLHVTSRLLEVLRQRPIFELTVGEQVEVPVEGGVLYEVAGSFHPQLNWEVLRILLTWAGSVRVVEPDWLAIAFARRCVEGLLVQLTGPLDGEAVSYPLVGEPGAAERLAALDEYAGALAGLHARLAPAPDGDEPEPGKARKVRPPPGFDA